MLEFVLLFTVKYVHDCTHKSIYTYIVLTYYSYVLLCTMYLRTRTCITTYERMLVACVQCCMLYIYIRICTLQWLCYIYRVSHVIHLVYSHMPLGDDVNGTWGT